MKEDISQLQSAYGIAREILQFVFFARHNFRETLLNTAHYILTHEIENIDAKKRNQINFEDSIFPLQVIPLNNTIYLPVLIQNESDTKKAEKVSQPGTAAFCYLQIFLEQIVTYRLSSLKNPFQTWNLSIIKSNYSFEEAKNVIVELYQNGWFPHPHYAAHYLHILYRDKYFDLNTYESFKNPSNFAFSYKKMGRLIKKYGHKHLQWERYFINLARDNRKNKRSMYELKKVALGSYKDCVENINTAKVECENISEWIHVLSITAFILSFSLQVLKEIYYTVEDSDERLEIEKETCLVDELLCSIADFFRSPYLMIDTFLSDLRTTYEEKGLDATKRNLKYYMKGRVFLPLKYKDNLLNTIISSDPESNPISLEGLSAGHKIALSIAEKYRKEDVSIYEYNDNEFDRKTRFQEIIN